MVRFLAQALLISVVFIAAWRVGGKPERYVSTVYLFMLVGSTANAFSGGADTEADYAGLHVLHFALDAAAFVAILAIALRYDRWWTIWVGSVQLIAVMAHLLRAFEMPMPQLAYAIMERWPVWLAVIITGAATIAHHRRRQVIASGI